MSDARETALRNRAPFQVLVLPFRHASPLIEFAIFRRSDAGYWQGVAGGGAIGESPLDAARREAFEEAGIPLTAPFYELTSLAHVPVVGFESRVYWPAGTYVIPEHCFAVDATGIDVVLSSEHTEFEWLPFEAAHERLYWQSNRVALWELSRRVAEQRW